MPSFRPMSKRKRCRKCRRWLAMSSFCRCARSPDGRNYECRKCCRDRYFDREDRLTKNGELSQAAQSGRRLRLLVLKHYGGDPPVCACCGEHRIEFLAIDHVNGDGAEHRRQLKQQVGGQSICRWLRDNRFPAGFRVLCSNCNTAIGAYGMCPHETERLGLDPPFRVQATRSQIAEERLLAAAWQLIESGMYPGIHALAEKIDARPSNVREQRTRLSRSGKWPCTIIPRGGIPTNAYVSGVKVVLSDGAVRMLALRARTKGLEP